jgi:hypothetical protein
VGVEGLGRRTEMGSSWTIAAWAHCADPSFEAACGRGYVCDGG